MSEELDNFRLDEETRRKIRQKKRMRGILLVFNLLLVTYFGYLAVDGIITMVNNSKKRDENQIITLRNKSVDESIAIYNKYLQDNNVEIADYATYGRYFLTSSSRVDYSHLHYRDSVLLTNLSSSPFTFYVDDLYLGKIEGGKDTSLGQYLDEQIDLYSLAKGDYVLFDSFTLTGETKGVPYYYQNVNGNKDVLYSFPDASSYRKRITIQGKASSYALLIQVDEVSSLPNDYYDLVIVGSSETYKVFEESSLKVKYVNSLVDAYLTKASYALVVTEGNDIVSSAYVSLETTKSEKIVSNSIYNNLDSNDYIRELGGYVFNAGFGVNAEDLNEEIKKSSLAIKNIKGDERVGKYTLVVGQDVTFEQIKEILKF